MLARSAVESIDRTDFLIDRADVRMGLADVLRIVGPIDEAADLLGEATSLEVRRGPA